MTCMYYWAGERRLLYGHSVCERAFLDGVLIPWIGSEELCWFSLQNLSKTFLVRVYALATSFLGLACYRAEGLVLKRRMPYLG